jgi:hypothetical protein
MPELGQEEEGQWSQLQPQPLFPAFFLLIERISIKPMHISITAMTKKSTI